MVNSAIEIMFLETVCPQSAHYDSHDRHARMHDLRVSIECQTIKTGSLSLGVSKTQTPLLQIAAAIEADIYAAYTSAI